jgi:hypothetical protein
MELQLAGTAEQDAMPPPLFAWILAGVKKDSLTFPLPEGIF